jgi:PA14 domain
VKNVVGALAGISALLLAVSFFSVAPVAEASARRGLSVDIYSYRNDPDEEWWEDSTPWVRLMVGARRCETTMLRQINHDWEQGKISRRCGVDDLLLHYTGQLRVPQSGDYTFYTISDDGFRLTIGTELVIDDWEDQGPEEIGVWNADGEISLVGGRRYVLDAWMYENGGGAVAKLYYSVDGGDAELVPSTWYSNR